MKSLQKDGGSRTRLLGSRKIICKRTETVDTFMFSISFLSTLSVALGIILLSTHSIVQTDTNVVAYINRYHENVSPFLAKRKGAGIDVQSLVIRSIPGPLYNSFGMSSKYKKLSAINYNENSFKSKEKYTNTDLYTDHEKNLTSNQSNKRNKINKETINDTVTIKKNDYPDDYCKNNYQTEYSKKPASISVNEKKNTNTKTALLSSLSSTESSKLSQAFRKDTTHNYKQNLSQDPSINSYVKSRMKHRLESDANLNLDIVNDIEKVIDDMIDKVAKGVITLNSKDNKNDGTKTNTKNINFESNKSIDKKRINIDSLGITLNEKIREGQKEIDNSSEALEEENTDKILETDKKRVVNENETSNLDSSRDDIVKQVDNQKQIKPFSNIQVLFPQLASLLKSKATPKDEIELMKKYNYNYEHIYVPNSIITESIRYNGNLTQKDAINMDSSLSEASPIYAEYIAPENIYFNTNYTISSLLQSDELSRLNVSSFISLIRNVGYVKNWPLTLELFHILRKKFEHSSFLAADKLQQEMNEKREIKEIGNQNDIEEEGKPSIKEGNDLTFCSQVKQEYVTPREYQIVLKVLFSNDRAAEAYKLWKECIQNSLEPGIITYNILLKSLSKNQMMDEFWKVYEHMRSNKDIIKMDHYTYSTLISVATRTLPWHDVENVLHGAIKENLATNYVFSSLIKELKKRKNQLDNDYVFPSGESLLVPLTKEELSSSDTSASRASRSLIEDDRQDHSRTSNLNIDNKQNKQLSLGKNKIRSFSSKYITNNKVKQAFHVLNIMRYNTTVKPDTVTYTAAISVCERIGDVANAVRMFEAMKEDEVTPNLWTYSACISTCAKGRRLDLALDFWHQLHEQGLKPNTVLYNSIISACEKGRDLMRALNILSTMYQDQVPRDVITYNSVISACEKAGNHKKALYFLNKMYAIDGIHPDTVSYNSALSACAKGLQIEKAKDLLIQMKQQNIPRDAFTYNSLMDAYARTKNLNAVMSTFTEMKQDGKIKPDIISFTQALTAAEKMRDWVVAESLLAALRESGIRPNQYTYNVLISISEKTKNQRLALNLLREMKRQGMSPDVMSYTSAIGACWQANQDLNQCLSLYETLQKEGVLPSVYTFTILIPAAIQSRNFKKAMKLYLDMKEIYGISPNGVFLSSVLCSLAENNLVNAVHSVLGKIEKNAVMDGKGSEINYYLTFDREEEFYYSPQTLSIEDYHLILKRLCRRSYLETSMTVIQHMKRIKIKPDITAYNFVLLACASSDLPTVGTDALNILSLIRKDDIIPNVFSFINVVRACTRVGKPNLISDLLTDIKNDDRYFYSWEFYNAAITVFHQGGFYAEADSIYQAAVNRQIIQPWVAEEDLNNATTNPLHVNSPKKFGVKRKSNVIDLHCLTIPLAHATVRFALQTIQREMDNHIIGENGLSNSKDKAKANDQDEKDYSLLIITGIGKRSINKLEPVIRPQVQDMLLEQFYPPLSSMTVPGNTGRVIVTEDAIRDWVRTAKSAGLHPFSV